MSIQPSHDLLPTLRAMRDKIELDPHPLSPALLELYILIVHRINLLETVRACTAQRGLRVS